MDDDFRLFRHRIWIFVIGMLLIAGAATIASRAFDLAWFPWDVRMKTGMIRASNSYVTTQQAALRQFRMAYNDGEASQEQKAGIVRQMHEVADTIPEDVQPDIAAFLATH